MAQDWQIKPLGHACSATGEAFEDGQPIICCLVHSAEGYERKDFSLPGWEHARPAELISYWKTVYRAPPPPAPEPIRKETAESLLRQFIAKEDYSRAHAIYVLAVMLERKRILVEKDVQWRDDGRKLRIYEHRKTGEVFTIPDPELKLSDLDSVRREVEELLGLSSIAEGNDHPKDEKPGSNGADADEGSAAARTGA